MQPALDAPVREAAAVGRRAEEVGERLEGRRLDVAVDHALGAEDAHEHGLAHTRASRTTRDGYSHTGLAHAQQNVRRLFAHRPAENEGKKRDGESQR